MLLHSPVFYSRPATHTRRSYLLHSPMFYWRPAIHTRLSYAIALPCILLANCHPYLPILRYCTLLCFIGHLPPILAEFTLRLCQSPGCVLLATCHPNSPILPYDTLLPAFYWRPATHTRRYYAVALSCLFFYWRLTTADLTLWHSPACVLLATCHPYSPILRYGTLLYFIGDLLPILSDLTLWHSPVFYWRPATHTRRFFSVFTHFLTTNLTFGLELDSLSYNPTYYNKMRFHLSLLVTP